MVWRSVARIESLENLPKIFGAIGGLGLMISDTILGLDRFRSENKYAKIELMLAYFISYLGYALSIYDNDFNKEIQIEEIKI